nr:hypothetical protein BHI3_37290 [Bacteriovorax sp. HI3]
MNSKILLLSLISITLSSCGVKAPPVQYPDTSVDSYIREYTGTTELTPEEIERTKDKPPVSSVEDQVRPSTETEDNKKTTK